MLTRAQLLRALRMHNRTGVRLGEALVSLGLTTEDEVALALANQQQCEFVDLRDFAPDPTVRIHTASGNRSCAARATAPRNCQRRAGRRHPGVPDQELEAELQVVLQRAVRIVVVSPSAFDETLDSVYRTEFLEQAASYLVTRSPDDSARWVLTRPQKLVLLIALVAALVFFAARPAAAATFFVLSATIVYSAFCAYKIYLAARALTHSLEIEVTADEVAELDDRELPVYTLLIPVYHEARSSRRWCGPSSVWIIPRPSWTSRSFSRRTTWRRSRSHAPVRCPAISG